MIGRTLTRFSSAMLILVLTGSMAVAGEAESEALPDPTLAPRPAEIMPLASRSLMLSIDQSGDTYYAVGMRGHILRSTDGIEWEQQPAPVRSKLNRVRFVEDGQGWIVGNDGIVMHSADGGDNWELRNFDAEQHPLYDLYAMTDEVIFAAGAKGQVLRSDDGGSNWELFENEYTDLGFHFFSFLELADGRVVLIGEKGLICVLSDNGESWEMLHSPYIGSWFGALPYGEHGLLVYGLRGHVYVAENLQAAARENIETFDEFEAVTVDSAAKLAEMGWRKVESGTDQGLLGGTLLEQGEVLLVGINGIAIRSHGLVRQFTPVYQGAEFSLNDLILAGNRALAVGKNGAAWISLLPDQKPSR